MKTEYIWNYDIKVKDKDGVYIYEKETLEKLKEILKEHPEYQELEARHIKELKRSNKK